uniref:Putative equilibrative nucleoside transporter, Major facilitator superfamily domain protein n=1 Tax=Helianthus annuus TaxID=4232 RepID=A0A251TIL6_HELAN
MSATVAALLTLMCWSTSSRIKLPPVRTSMNIGQGFFISALMVAPVTNWIVHGKQTRLVSNIAFVVLVSMVMISGSTTVGATGELPGRYMLAVFAGNATAGLVVSILRIVTKASLPYTQQGLRTSTQIYFVISALIILLCIICTNVLHKLPIIRYYRNLNREHNNNSHMSTSSNFLHVVKKIRWLVTAVFETYVVSLSIFPGYLSENVRSDYFKDWYPIILITTFNVGDFLGKCLTAIYVPNGSKGTVWCCLGSVLFYPLFLGCKHGPRWMHSEVPVVVLTLMLGVSNGYLTSVLMILAPKSVPIEEAEVVGIAMETSLVIGLVVGSAFGWLWNFEH